MSAKSAKRSASRALEQGKPSEKPVVVEDPAQVALTRRRKRLTIGIVAAALLVYAALGWLSVTSKSPTYDEPLHAIAAWLQVHERDFRVDPEDPPLWKYWAALPTRRDDVKVSLKVPPGTAATQATGQPVKIDPKDKVAPALRYRLVAEDIYHEWP